jgi:MYXO-CTERM domain-containing protein
MAAPETCNAVDDDCNGQVDDGMLCSTDQVCDSGKCVFNCLTGEFPCPPDTGCSSRGVCVETACIDKPCPAGQVCKGGDCVEPCTGVVCPHGLACRNGGCVDLCQGLQCDPGSTCVLGVCQSCACSECDSGKVCHQNLCIDSGCENQTCAAGTHCEAGTCKGNCDGAVCPHGQLCSNGDCVIDPSAAVSSGGGGGQDSLSFGGSPISYGGDGAVIVAGSTGSAGRRGAGTASKPACSCQLPGQRTPGTGAGTVLLLALFGLARRRRHVSTE